MTDERQKGLTDGNMKTGLLPLVLDIATALLTQIAQYLSQNRLQDGIRNLCAARTVCMANRLIEHILNIKSGTKAMAALLRGIPVCPEQAGDIVLRSQHARHDNTMQRHILYVQAVQEILAYLLQQVGCPGDQVRDALRHAPVNAVKGIGSYIHQFLLAVFRLCPVLHGPYTPAAGGHYLHLLQIGETLLVGIYTTDAVTASGLFHFQFPYRLFHSLLLHDVLRGAF